MSAYTEAVNQRVRLEAELTQLRKQFTAKEQELLSDIDKWGRVIYVAERGVDADQFVIAREILDIKWARQVGDGDQRRGNAPYTGQHRPFHASGELDVWNDARQRLREGGGSLSQVRIAIKQYEGWTAQRSDSEYGYGPRHGSIWFSIGLSDQRRRQMREHPLTEEEILACIAWLDAVEANPELLP